MFLGGGGRSAVVAEGPFFFLVEILEVMCTWGHDFPAGTLRFV